MKRNPEGLDAVTVLIIKMTDKALQYIGNLPALHRLLAYPAPRSSKRRPLKTGPRRKRRRGDATLQSRVSPANTNLVFKG